MRTERGPMVDFTDPTQPIELDRNGLVILSQEDCLALLAHVPVGRVGVTMNALPVILPVNFAIATPPGDDQPAVVVRTSPGTKLSAALDQSVVALEADSFDPVTHSGWSVLVQGTSRVLRDEADVAWAASLPLRPWADTDDANWFILLSMDVVRGRVLRSGSATASARPGLAPDPAWII